MKRFFLVMILFFSCMLVALARGGVDSVLVRLDRVMGQQEIYMEQKEERIDSLKQLLHHSSLTLRQQFILNKALGAEYELFVSDSAMKYFDNSLPWTAAHQASLSITNSQNLLKLMSIELVMLSNHLILCHPLSSCLQSFPASGSVPI